ncbi:MAG TPA: hypothetical protein VLJ58_21240 [Ramlibacter sp.]|nr:hypothetical protein [Ramlibacter sp.]
MTRVVGQRNRTEFVLDPAEALRLGRRLDAMLAAARPGQLRGVLRATHRAFNDMDDQRQLAAARRLNKPAS